MGKSWIEEYEKKVRDRKCSYEEIKHFLKAHIPKTLYRYYAMDDWYKFNVEGALHFNKPSQFNDPFDSSVMIDFSKIFKGLYPDYDLPLKNGEKFIEKVFQGEQEQVIQNIQNEFYITCFSEKYDSILMWCHYANKHTGFCVEYDCEGGFELDCMLYPIIYKEERYDASEIYYINDEDRKNVHVNPILFKSPEWEYEKEWRLFFSEDYLKSGNIELSEDNNYFMKQKIKKIYLGMKFDKVKYKEFIEICQKKEIEIAELKMDEKLFRLICV